MDIFFKADFECSLFFGVRFQMIFIELDGVFL